LRCKDYLAKVQVEDECGGIPVRIEGRLIMNAETILGILLIIVGAVILGFSAIGIAFVWIIKQAQIVVEKDERRNARKP
jgi:hypothetical protein